MGKKDLRRKRDKVKALYGLNPDEERLIDVTGNKKSLRKYRIMLIFFTVLAIFLSMICYRFDKIAELF